MQRIIIFALSAIATALGVEITDPAEWFGSTAVLAVIVGAVIAYLRTAVKTLDGVAVVIVSVLTGGILSGLGFAGGLHAADTTLVQAVAFGLGAGWLASGGVDLFRSIFPKSPAPAG